MLNVAGLSKAYGPTQALADVSFVADPGLALAVVGENGAGKSTLVKVLAGAVRPDAGSISLDGQPVRCTSPRDALRQGIALIPQELAYAPQLSVAENIMLGMLPSRLGIVSRRVTREKARAALNQVGPDLALDTPLARLSLAEKQLVEIAKALARNARVLLLDEPSAALSGRETTRLFQAVARLKEQSAIIIYISHRLDEVIEHCDNILVLRDGRVAGRGPVQSFTKASMVQSMLGPGRQAADASATTIPAPASEPILVMAGLSHRQAGGLQGLDMRLHRGQITGLFGLRGGGQDAAVETLAGLRPHTSGTLTMAGDVLARIKSPRAARRRGILYVPADRKGQGLVMAASIRANLSLPQLSQLARFGIVSHAGEQRLLAGMARKMLLKYRDGRQLIGELSGGNQQKVLIGSRLGADPAVLLLHEPTRGVDVGARQEIHGLIRDLARSGVAIVLATTDIEEAVELATVLHVLRGGRITESFEGADKTQENARSAAG
ncbi:MAG: sugar ABC transporter ATP-binding protein [Streptosporangiaceae bacterium]